MNRTSANSTAGPLVGSDRVAYLPSIDRPTVSWPNGAQVALWVAPNVEHYEYLPPRHPSRNPWVRSPHPDVQGYSYRDFGNRVGFWRMLEALDEVGVRCTASTNLAVFDHYPEVAEAMVSRNWEIMSHGVYNTRYLTGMEPADEREFYETCVDTLRLHTGQQLKGMLGPAVSNTAATPDLMVEAGLIYHADWFHDDQPVPLKVATSGASGADHLVSVPYSIELNDVPVFAQHWSMDDFAEMARAQMTRLLAEAAADGSGRVMCLALHPFLVGMAHRVDGLRALLADLVGREGVWQTTAAEIAEHFIANSYDSFVSHAEQLAPTPSKPAQLSSTQMSSTQSTPPPVTTTDIDQEGTFGPATPAYGMDHPYYDWSPAPTRTPIAWPNDAPLALGVVVLLEHYEWEPPADAYQLRTRSGGLLALPPPDYAKLTHREYGHRVGVFRLLEALKAAGITPTVAIDALTIERYPWLAAHVAAQGAELVGHGVAASRLITSKLSEADERETIATATDTIVELTGTPPTGWLSPEGVESHRTPRLVAEAGYGYLLDWPNDEQPYAMNMQRGTVQPQQGTSTETGSDADLLWSLPMALEFDDEFAMWHRRVSPNVWAKEVVEAARVLRRSAEQPPGSRSLVLCLRPWLTGQPFRISAVEQALGGVLNLGDTFCATTGEIVTAAQEHAQNAAQNAADAAN